MDNLGVHLYDSEDRRTIIQEVVKLSLSDEVNEKQVLEPILMQIKDNVGQQKDMAFVI